MTPDRDDSPLAAEYVMGLLDTEARADAERRIASDADFARQVETWRARFSQLDDTAEEVAPAGDLWQRIESSLSKEEVPVARAHAVGVIGRFWRSLAALRIATLGSAITTILLAIVAVAALQHAQQVAARKPIYVAILIDDATRQAGAVVNAFADGRVEMIPLVDMNVPDGRALQVWTLWNREIGPRSVGLLSRAKATQLDLEKLPGTTADQLFEITLEPAGGSPTGRPTGPILYKGTTARTL
jgi:anti-sigma-K factor RskA